MGDVIFGKDVILQEYEPLHNLLQLLPTKAQLGPKSFVGQARSLKERGVKHLLSSLKEKAHDNLRNIPVYYTCFDISHHVVVLGSNLGIIFFYDRNNCKLTGLQGSEANDEPVTCLRLFPLQSSIAAGFNNGHIFIYSYMLSSQGLNKHECMQVLGAHSSTVTCLEWSQDGTVLYSGDNDGRIVMTVVKVKEGVTQSALLFVEDTPIVQLSYSSMALLVSTYKRTVTWSFTSEEPIQLGHKERKSPGNYGACFFPPADPYINPVMGHKIYASRPGLRLWTAQPDGKVYKTRMYKGLMSENPPGIRTLTSLPSRSLAQATRVFLASAMQFGTVEIFHGQFILTWDRHRLWLLDTWPCTAVVCFHHYFHGDIVDVCSVGDEVFILQQSGPRLIRTFSLIPELPNPFRTLQELMRASYAKNDKDKDSPPRSRPPCKNTPSQPTSTSSPDKPLTDKSHPTSAPSPGKTLTDKSTAKTSPRLALMTILRAHSVSSGKISFSRSCLWRRCILECCSSGVSNALISGKEILLIPSAFPLSVISVIVIIRTSEQDGH